MAATRELSRQVYLISKRYLRKYLHIHWHFKLSTQLKEILVFRLLLRMILRAIILFPSLVGETGRSNVWTGPQRKRAWGVTEVSSVKQREEELLDRLLGVEVPTLDINAALIISHSKRMSILFIPNLVTNLPEGSLVAEAKAKSPIEVVIEEEIEEEDPTFIKSSRYPLLEKVGSRDLGQALGEERPPEATIIPEEEKEEAT